MFFFREYCIREMAEGDMKAIIETFLEFGGV